MTEATAELEQLPLLRPPRKGGCGGESDYWRTLNFGEQQAARRHMSPDGMGIDELATHLGVDVDVAWKWWLERLHLETKSHDPRKLTDDEIWGTEQSPRYNVTDELMDPSDVANLLGVSVGTVHTWVRRRVIIPPARKFGNCPAWWMTDILNWAMDSGRA